MIPNDTKFKVSLIANGVEIVESNDFDFWQQCLLYLMNKTPMQADRDPSVLIETPSSIEETDKKSINIFAEEVGVAKDVVVGALDPTHSPPYLHIDIHCWETFKKNHPSRGPHSLSSFCICATLLALWFKFGDFSEKPSMKMVTLLLKKLDIKCDHPSAQLKQIKWLQKRDSYYAVNPIEVSKAISLVKAFCLKEKFQK